MNINYILPDQKTLRLFQDKAAVYHEKEAPYKRKGRIELLFLLMIAVIAAVAITTFCFQQIEVFGSSMYPTFVESERVVAEKFTYRFHEPHHSDVVICKYVGDDRNMIKRIIGLPGDTIEIRNGVVYRNDVELDESNYWNDIIFSPTTAMEPVLVPEKSIFVMGDNRNNSLDSRQAGVVPYERVVGHVVLRIYPFNKIGGFPQ